MVEPSGKRRSQSPESSGPRWDCTCVMRARVSESPQFASPLMPHITSAPRFLQLVNFGLRVEHLHRLKCAVNQAGDAVQKPQTKYIAIGEQQAWGAGHPEKLSLEPAAALGLRSPQSAAQLAGIFFAPREHARFPVGILVVLLDVTRQRFDVVMHNRIS